MTVLGNNTTTNNLINSKRRRSLFSNKTQQSENIYQLTEQDLSPEKFKEVSDAMCLIEEFDFNVFDVDKLVGKKTLHFVSNEIFELLNFFEDLIDEGVYKKFINEIEKGYYRDCSPYHNDIHAADVLQTTYVIMERGSFYYRLSLCELDYLGILLAALCHDFKHPGIGNSYLINSKHSIAMNYNGKYMYLNIK